MFWQRKREVSPLAATLRQLQDNLVKESDKAGENAFLARLAVAMDHNPEPFQWILMVLRQREKELTKHQAIRNPDDFFAFSLKQRELSSEVRLLRSLARMSVHARTVLVRQEAMAQQEIESDEQEDF
jgi:hypothetical protein